MGDEIKKRGEETRWSSGDVKEQEEEEVVAAWGTLEELLLVSAVNRHGTNSWDSIATQLHKRLLLDKPFTPDLCRRKYLHLKRRFNTLTLTRDDDLLRMVQELRQLRVQQLHRDLHNHDLSILSLEEKVKTLEEKSKLLLLLVKEEKPDLRIQPDLNNGSGSRSVNESNSAPPPRRMGESGSESKLNDDSVDNKIHIHQSSDVQSSASLCLSKNKRRRFTNDIDIEADEEELSPANKRINVKSQPLIRFHHLILSHKHASVFHPRLPTQETEKYRNVVRQHMDLDMVQLRLDRGVYSESHLKFYRDLLLMFTNAILFYRKSSAEHIAAHEMRKLVIDEISLRTHKSKTLPSKPDLETQHREPVVKKPRSSTLILCRRQSSMQVLSESLKEEGSHNVTSIGIKKNDITKSKVGNGREEKLKDDEHKKKVDRSSSSNSNGFVSRKEQGGDKGDEDANSKKSLTRERSNLGRGTLRLSNNNNKKKKKIISKDGSKREKMVNGDTKEGGSKGDGDDPMEKRKVNIGQKQEKTTAVLKKQGVAKFLKRIKQNSPSSQEKVMNNDSNDEDDDEKGEVGRNEKTDSNGKKMGGNARELSTSKGVDVVVTRRSSGRKGEKEAATSSKATGRPPKRKAAMISGDTPDSRKRGQSGGRGSGQKSKKKSRR